MESSIKGEMLPVGEALVDSVLGYLVVFIGLALLMMVIILMGRVMIARSRKGSPSPHSVPAEVPAAQTAPAPKKLAPGSAGEVKLYDTDPRDAAMIMAIVADKMQKPLNELRFVSIKEVKENEI